MARAARSWRPSFGPRSRGRTTSARRACATASGTSMAVFEFPGPKDLAAWMREPGSDAGVVVASRVRLSRNLRTHPYPGICSAEEEARLREEILETIRH